MRIRDLMLRGIIRNRIINRPWLAIIAIFLLSFNVTGAYAQDYPSQYAAKEGYKEISKFRNIFLPLWNTAYPSKNYEALLAAAPDIDSATNVIYKMHFNTRFKDRLSSFNERKYALMKSVSDYKNAAKNSDSAAVFQLLPQIQSEFESTAVILLPLPYSDIERLIVKAKLLTDSLINNGDTLEMAEATDTIIARIQRLSPDSLPDQAKDKANLAVDEFSYFNKLSIRMKDALAIKDMEKYRMLAIELGVRLVNFRYKFLL